MKVSLSFMYTKGYKRTWLNDVALKCMFCMKTSK
jgi:hypothetical protein